MTEIRLAAQVGRVPSMVVPLDAGNETRFAALMADLLLIDLHQHTLVMPCDLNDAYAYASSHAYTWGYESIRAGRWSTVGAACNMAALMRGGVVCVTAVPNALSDDPAQDINCVLDHYDYLVKLVGIDHVGIGTDTTVGDHVGFTRLLMQPGATPPAPYLNGLESPADAPNIVRGLIARGYSDSDVRKIAGQNVLDLLRRVL